MTAPLDRVFDGADLRADLARHGSDRLMVTFDYRRLNRDGFADPVPSQRFAQAGFDHLMIATRRNDWFINGDTLDLDHRLRALRDAYALTRGLGFSMGGFGAFRFSAALGLDHVVAVSPQVSIAPQVVPFETRYRREARTFDPALGDMASLHDDHLSGTILIDPFNLNDLTHARMLQILFPRVRLLRLPGGGHPCTHVLRQAGRAGLVQGLALDPGSGAATLLRCHRANRSGSAGYWQALDRAAGPRHPAWASRARQMALGLTADPQDGVDAGRDSA